MSNLTPNDLLPEICFETAIGRMCFPITSTPTFPGPVVPSTDDAPAAWRAYRAFSSALQLLGRLEERAPIEVMQLREAVNIRTTASIERVFVTESFRQAQMAARDAAHALRRFRGTIPRAVLDDGSVLLARVRDRFPDLPEPIAADLQEVFRHNGTPGRWMQSVLGLLDRRTDIYAQIADRLRHDLAGDGEATIRRIEAMLHDLHATDPRPHPVRAVDGKTDKATKTKLEAALKEAQKDRDAALAKGVPPILATARERGLREMISVLHPDLVPEFGLSGDIPPLPVLWCIIGGPCWWKVTGVAIALAVSSHNVE